MTLAWAIHKGIRTALGPKRNFAFLRQVVIEFKVGRAPARSDMGEDIQERIMTAVGGSVRTDAVPVSDITNGGQRSIPGQPSRNTHRKNETTAPAADQSAAEALGTARNAILKIMFEVDATWEIDWQKVDLSDGFYS